MKRPASTFFNSISSLVFTAVWYHESGGVQVLLVSFLDFCFFLFPGWGMIEVPVPAPIPESIPVPVSITKINTVGVTPIPVFLGPAPGHLALGIIPEVHTLFPHMCRGAHGASLLLMKRVRSRTAAVVAICGGCRLVLFTTIAVTVSIAVGGLVGFAFHCLAFSALLGSLCHLGVCELHGGGGSLLLVFTGLLFVSSSSCSSSSSSSLSTAGCLCSHCGTTGSTATAGGTSDRCTHTVITAGGCGGGGGGRL